MAEEEFKNQESCVQIDPAQLEYGPKVGSGATADVYRGTWRTHTVAIKQVFLQNRSTSLKEQVAFTREVAIMSKVKHHNLVDFHGVCFSECPFRIITEFCEGGTLFELLHNCQEIDLVWAQQHKMCCDIAHAMDYLHKFNPQIIHRDLKSLNCLMTTQVKSERDFPHVKVTDFGLARMKAADKDAEWEKMTKEAGTCHWMAPEVLTGEYNQKADIYSYAIVLFEIICREIPFDDEQPENIAAIITKKGRPDLEAVPPDCPKDLRELMEKCWAHAPDERPNFSIVLEILDNIDDGAWSSGVFASIDGSSGQEKAGDPRSDRPRKDPPRLFSRGA